MTNTEKNQVNQMDMDEQEETIRGQSTSYMYIKYMCNNKQLPESCGSYSYSLI